MLGQLMYHRGINISQKLLIKMRKYFLMGGVLLLIYCF